MCVQQVVYLFEPWTPDHKERQSKLLGLDRILGTSMAEGLVLTTPDNRSILVENAVVDNGSQAPCRARCVCRPINLHCPHVKAVAGCMHELYTGCMHYA